MASTSALLEREEKQVEVGVVAPKTSGPSLGLALLWIVGEAISLVALLGVIENLGNRLLGR